MASSNGTYGSAWRPAPLLAVLIACVVATAPAIATAEDGQEKSQSSGEESELDDGSKARVSFDVNNASLLDLTIWMSHLTGENFILLDQELEDRKVTIYAPQPVTIEEACEMFVSALRLQGLHVENAGAYWKITALK